MLQPFGRTRRLPRRAGPDRAAHRVCASRRQSGQHSTSRKWAGDAAGAALRPTLSRRCDATLRAGAGRSTPAKREVGGVLIARAPLLRRPWRARPERSSPGGSVHDCRRAVRNEGRAQVQEDLGWTRCRVGPVSNVRFRPGNSACSRRLEPSAGKQTLRALDMRATIDRDDFFAFQHGVGQLKLIKRLAAAYRADELPEYMLEFFDSLRTRPKATHLLSSRSERAYAPVPKTCPHDSLPQAARSRLSSFPATFGASGEGHNVEALRITEVLRPAEQQHHFQALCARERELQRSTCGTERCSAMLAKATELAVLQVFLGEKAL